MTTHHNITFKLYMNVQTVQLVARHLTGTGC